MPFSLWYKITHYNAVLVLAQILHFLVDRPVVPMLVPPKLKAGLAAAVPPNNPLPVAVLLGVVPKPPKVLVGCVSVVVPKPPKAGLAWAPKPPKAVLGGPEATKGRSRTHRRRRGSETAEGWLGLLLLLPEQANSGLRS